MDIQKHAYTTTDFSLAVTLATLGVKFINHDGQIAAKTDQVEWREIFASELDKLGISFDQAVAQGLGQIAYGFAEHPQRSAIIQAFRDAREKFKTGDMEIPDTFEIKCQCGEAHSVETVPVLAAFSAYLFGARKALADRRKHAKAKLRGPVTASATGEKEVNMSYSIIDPKDA